MARLNIRIDFAPGGRLGPGKIALLEEVAVAAAGRAMGMSYRRAWELVAELNATFRRPLVTAKTGGRRGGGASLTPLGEDLVARYRAIEENAKRAAATDLRALERSLPRG
jgi:molybdate transport system regulatory protein